MKKILVLLLSAILIFTSSGCIELPFDVKPSETESITEPEQESTVESTPETESHEESITETEPETETPPDSSEEPKAESAEESLSEPESEETRDEEEANALPAEWDRFGYGLFDTRLAAVRREEPAYTRGVTLCDTLLYPAPVESVYELGFVYQGRTVEILTAVQVITYDEHDMMIGSEWLLVIADKSGTIGYLKKEDVGNADEVQVEAGEPWQIKAGAAYYFNSACVKEETSDYPIGPLWITEADEENGVWTLDGLSGFRVFIKDLSVLEICSKLGRPRNSRAG